MNDIGPPEEPPKRLSLKRVMLGLLAILILVATAVYFLTPPVEIRITEAQARLALQPYVGQTERTSFGIAEITPRRLEPHFEEGNTLSLDAALQISRPNLSLDVEGNIRAGIRYRAPHVYLTRIDTSGMRIDTSRPDSEDQRSRLSDMLDVARDKIRREREEMSPDARDALDRLIGAGGEELPDLAARSVAALISTVPIYDLRDAGLKGSVAALALQDVRFEEGEAVLTLSARAAILRILSVIGIIALILLYVSWQMLLGSLIDKGINRLADGRG